jgi:uncharacterized protein YunC (DUF1805 family)
MITQRYGWPVSRPDGYVHHSRQGHLVNVVTDVGIVGCGAFDVAALNSFGYPATRVKPTRSSYVASKDDLLG